MGIEDQVIAQRVNFGGSLHPVDCLIINLLSLAFYLFQLFRFLSPLSAVPLVTLVGFGLYEFGFPGVSIEVDVLFPFWASSCLLLYNGEMLSISFYI